MELLTIILAWPFAAGALTFVEKKVAEAFGFRDRKGFVKTLPIHPEAWGVLLSLLFVPVLRNSELTQYITLDKLGGLALFIAHVVGGITAGAVSSKVWKLWRQGLRQDDRRL